MSFELFSPEEVSERTRKKISPWKIRQLAREGKIEFVRIERGKILFTEAQIQGFLSAWTQTVLPPPPAEQSGLAFKGTSRSRAARAQVAVV